jgi:hypothetical protein
VDDRSDAIQREFENMLSSMTILTVNLRRLSAFLLWLEAELPDWSDRERSDRAQYVIFEAALRPAQEVTAGRKTRKPLLGAKHLLGLGEYDVLSPEKVVADTDRSLAFFKKETSGRVLRDHPLDDLSLRQRIASNAAGYGNDRSNATKRLPEFAGSLWSEVQEVVKEPELRAMLKARRASVMQTNKDHDAYVAKRNGASEGQAPPEAIMIPETLIEPRDFPGPNSVAVRNEVASSDVFVLEPSDVPRSDARARPKLPMKVVRTKHRRTRKFWLFTVSLIGLGLTGVVVGVLAVIAANSHLPEVTATQTSVIRPYLNGASPDAADVVNFMSLTCARTSLVSSRDDAHLCTGGDDYPLYDPCFDVSDGVVDCPHVALDGAQAQVVDVDYRVGSLTDFYFDAANEASTVPAGASTDSFYPWAIVVRTAGKNIRCEVRYDSGKSPNLPVSYMCPEGPIQYVHSVSGLMDGSDPALLTFTPNGLTSEFDLDKSQTVWTIRAADPTSASEFNNVPVVQAFF